MSPRPGSAPLPSDSNLLAVPDIAHHQCGVFTTRQALASGLSRSQIRRRIDSGSWVPARGRAHRSQAIELTVMGGAWAAHLTWPDSVISHWTAAELHQFPVHEDGFARPGLTHVTAHPSLRSFDGLRNHAVRLNAPDVQQIYVLKVTSPARTALDCLALLPSEKATRLWAWVSSRGVLNQAALVQALPGFHHRYGITTLRWLANISSDGAVNLIEARTQELLITARITGSCAKFSLKQPGTAPGTDLNQLNSG